MPLLTTHELACLACLASPASPARLALDRRDCHRCPYDPWNAQTWKAKDMAASERLAIEARALAVPVRLLEACHTYAVAVHHFLPHCNPSILSDAKVGVHLLAGAARAAYQTALVNSPAEDERARLRGMLGGIRAVEDAMLDGADGAAGVGGAPIPPPPAPKPAASAAAEKEVTKPAKPAKAAASKKEAPAELSAEEKAAKAAEKLKKIVVKEGGKKGVEIEGASDMGGLDFFCTTIESPDGDPSLLLTAMDAMNAQPNPDDEERKGCSGHVGKMIFSAGPKQLAIVAYVPKPEANKSADKIDVTAWIESVCAAVGGKITNPKASANTIPEHGGFVAEAIVLSDPEAGKFALKDKDAAMAAAFAYLREHGAFPEDEGDDDDDEPCFGDDAFDDIDNM